MTIEWLLWVSSGHRKPRHEGGVLSISISLIVGYFMLPTLVIAIDERQSCNLDTHHQIAILSVALLFAPQQRLISEALERQGPTPRRY